MSRKSIPTNISRQLWSQCGGYCQNPSCNKYLFFNVDEDLVSLANVAHIIGHGKAGPRSEHEVAEFIEKDGISNLIMLCLDCHKIVDELEDRFSVEEMQTWKLNHTRRIEANFSVPNFSIEIELLREINDLLDENKLIFDEYGPFSKKAIEGIAGDTQKIWRRRCLDTVIPNNQLIIDLIEKNKRNFGYPWELYRQMLLYKIHADSFRDNYILSERVNDYKLFPPEFDYYVKKSLGIPVQELEIREQEEIEYRYHTISAFIKKYLANHSFIKKMEQLNNAIFLVSLKDGRSLKVFVTNTYYFTEYTFNKVLTVDPNIDTIICSNPYASYSIDAKVLCIREKIGLFSLNEFMGAIGKQGQDFLNYLLKEERQKRIQYFSSVIEKLTLVHRYKIYLFGSFLRCKAFQDIDIILVYKNNSSSIVVDAAMKEIASRCKEYGAKLDFTVCSEKEFAALVLDFDNPVQIW